MTFALALGGGSAVHGVGSLVGGGVVLSLVAARHVALTLVVLSVRLLRLLAVLCALLAV